MLKSGTNGNKLSCLLCGLSFGILVQQGSPLRTIIRDIVDDGLQLRQQRRQRLEKRDADKVHKANLTPR